MKVVVVKIGEYSDQSIVGVFSSVEKAEDYIMRHNNPTNWWDVPYIDGEYEVDNPLLFADNMDNPIMYLTKFIVSHDSGNTIIKLGDSQYSPEGDINVKVKTYKQRDFAVYTDKHTNLICGGYIVLEEEYSKDKLIKIIADKVYQEMYDRIANINIICDIEEK